MKKPNIEDKVGTWEEKWMSKLKRFVGKSKEFLVDILIRYFAMIIFVIGTVWLLVETAWTIINIYNYYNNTKILVHNRILLFLIIILPVIIAFVYAFTLYKIKQKDNKIKENEKQFLQSNEIIRFHRNIIDDCFYDIYKNHKEILDKDIKSAFDNGNWKQVIKIGKYGSRLFLMLACYDMRIEYGNYIIKASEKLRDRESMAIGYIDCIGWSYVKQEKFDAAKDNIGKGLNVIENLKTKDSIIMKCKANRHLVGIMLKENNISGAKEYRDRFEKYLEKLKGKDKKIMKGSLHIINGDIMALESQDYENAKKCYKQAYKLFFSCDDFERTVKVNYKLGRMNENMGQMPKALKDYLIGFWLSDKVSRIDEKLKNCQGICRLISNDSELFQKVLADPKLNVEFNKNDINCIKEESYYIDELENLRKNIQF